MSNPKTAIVIGSIVAAFLPREIPPMTPWLLALMGLATDFFWYSTVVLLFSRPKAQRGYLRFKAWIDRVAGGVLAALGLKLMVTP